MSSADGSWSSPLQDHLGPLAAGQVEILTDRHVFRVGPGTQRQRIARVCGVMGGLNRGVRAVSGNGTNVALPGATAFAPVALTLAIFLAHAGMVTAMTSVAPSPRLGPLQPCPQASGGQEGSKPG